MLKLCYSLQQQRYCQSAQPETNSYARIFRHSPTPRAVWWSHKIHNNCTRNKQFKNAFQRSNMFRILSYILADICAHYVVHTQAHEFTF